MIADKMMESYYRKMRESLHSIQAASSSDDFLLLVLVVEDRFFMIVAGSVCSLVFQLALVSIVSFLSIFQGLASCKDSTFLSSVISWLYLPSSLYFFLIRNILCPRTVSSNSSCFFGSSIGNSLLYNFSSCWVQHCEMDICIVVKATFFIFRSLSFQMYSRVYPNFMIRWAKMKTVPISPFSGLQIMMLVCFLFSAIKLEALRKRWPRLSSTSFVLIVICSNFSSAYFYPLPFFSPQMRMNALQSCSRWGWGYWLDFRG